MSISLGELIFSVGLEDGEFSKSLTADSKKMEAFGKKATAVGKTLSTKLTAPIVGLGAVALKMATDFEVSSKKFGLAFEGASDKAAASVKQLNDEYGISNTQATALLGSTGDLLKGLGATSDEALVLADSSTKLAQALALANGVPLEQASNAIKSAMIGERDAMKQLDVVISEAAVSKQLLADGTNLLTGEELLLAKANATLTIATRQSGGAITGLQENLDTAKGSTGQLLGEMQDLAVDMGTILLPIFKDIVSEVRDAVKEFGDLDDETKETILKAAALVAAIGPLVTIIGTASTAISGLTTALAFLAANPIVAVIAALALLGTGIALAINKADQKRVEELTDEFTELGLSIGVTAEGMEEFAKSAAEAEDALRTFDTDESLETVADSVKRMSEDLGLTRLEIIKIGKNSDNLSDSFKDQLGLIEDQLKVAESINGREKLILGIKESQAKAVEDIVDSEGLITKELIAQKKLEEGIEDKYQKALSFYNELIGAQKTEADVLQEQIDYYTKLDDASDTYNKARADALVILKSKLKAITDAEVKIVEDGNQEKLDFLDKFNQDAEVFDDDRLEALSLARDADLAEAEKLGVDLTAITEYYSVQEQAIRDAMYDEDVVAMQEAHDEKAAIAAEDIIQVVESVINFVADITTAGTDAFSNNIKALDDQISGVNDKYDEQIDALSDLDEESEEYTTALADIEAARGEEVLALGLQIKAQEDAQKGLETLTQQVEGYTKAGLQYASGDTVGAIITAITTLLQPAMENIGLYMSEEMMPIFTRLNEIFEEIGGDLAEIIIPIIVILVEVLATVFEILAPVINSLKILTPLFELLFEVLEPVLEIIVALTPLIELLLTVGLLPLTAAIWVLGIILQPVILLLNLFSDAISAVSDYFVLLGEDIADAMKPVTDFFQGITDWADAIGDVDAFTNISDFFEELIRQIYRLIAPFRTIANTLARMFGGTDVLGDIGNFFGFDTGGFVTGSGATPIVVNESGQGEMMLSNSSAGQSLLQTFSSKIADNMVGKLPMGDDLFNKLSSSESALLEGSASAAQSGDNSTVNIVLDGKVIASSTVDLINNKILTIDSRSIR